MIHEKNIVIRPKPENLSLTLKQIARYAGGSRYRMDAGMKKKALPSMVIAQKLASPVAVYSVHDISVLNPDVISNFVLPEGFMDALYMAVCICTLGSEIENTVSRLMQEKKGLEAAFLDAAGVALLESLGCWSFSRICSIARKYDLFGGCRFGPGYNHVPMETQKDLFSLVDTTRIGVYLKNSLVMVPAKSLSFFVGIYKNEPVNAGNYKCSQCGLIDCPYRIGNKKE